MKVDFELVVMAHFADNPASHDYLVVAEKTGLVLGTGSSSAAADHAAAAHITDDSFPRRLINVFDDFSPQEPILMLHADTQIVDIGSALIDVGLFGTAEGSPPNPNTPS
ncbi:MAG: hypothetical protein L6Q57_03470 [Alphaproteobacteria bacterium]|nr:hypothetical protein [Alphaproteobacteria bacterium]